MTAPEPGEKPEISLEKAESPPVEPDKPAQQQGGVIGFLNALGPVLEETGKIIEQAAEEKKRQDKQGEDTKATCGCIVFMLLIIVGMITVPASRTRRKTRRPRARRTAPPPGTPPTHTRSPRHGTKPASGGFRIPTLGVSAAR
ncbi:hypothetical protein [Streptomyces sp. NPDC046685]|uniref:hypothetical protein n=1 Tax=Streptomyces sp. NPDC046685 TaxID=3157202 RepID=UPI0033F92F1E